MAYDELLSERIREALEGESGIVEKQMFGGLAFLIGGHMAVTVSRSGVLLMRCDPAETETLLGRPHTEPFEMRGRELNGWVRVVPAGIAADDDLAAWVERGVTLARSLPPKQPGRPRPRVRKP